MTDRIAESLSEVRARISAAARAAGRPADAIELVAVSKKQPVELIRAAYAAGQRHFGENYVQELIQKARALSDAPDIRWHLIGHLQRNKARQVVSWASSVHTVDSVELAKELARRRALLPEAESEASPLPMGFAPDPNKLAVLIEVNVGGEEQKSGCAPSDLPMLADEVEKLDELQLSGLMTVPPFTDDPKDSRPFFEQLAELRERLGGSARLPHLSMGMTRDLEHAIYAGSTLVRVGTAIFGERG